MATAAPSWARRLAIAAPMPREPPWISATLPLRLLLVMVDMLLLRIIGRLARGESSIRRRLHTDKPIIAILIRSKWFREQTWKPSAVLSVLSVVPKPEVLPEPH